MDGPCIASMTRLNPPEKMSERSGGVILPGTPNKATREVRELARRLVEDPEYQAALHSRLLNGQAGALEPLLWHYAYGKPKEPVELSTGEQPVVYRLTFDESADE